MSCTNRLNDLLIDGLSEAGNGTNIEYYDVFASNGQLFGFCARMPHLEHVYVQPEQLRGVRVVHPMRIGPQIHPLTVAVFLTSSICVEISK